jgi:hypothetical protein
MSMALPLLSLLEALNSRKQACLSQVRGIFLIHFKHIIGFIMHLIFWKF